MRKFAPIRGNPLNTVKIACNLTESQAAGGPIFGYFKVVQAASILVISMWSEKRRRQPDFWSFQGGPRSAAGGLDFDHFGL